MIMSLRWFALAVSSAAAAAQAEQVPSWAINLQRRVSLLEIEKADLQNVVADLRQELTVGRGEAKRQGPQSARVAVSSLGKSSIRQLTESPESCCRWTPGDTCQTSEEACTMVHEYIEGKALAVECGGTLQTYLEAQRVPCLEPVAQGSPSMHHPFSACCNCPGFSTSSSAWAATGMRGAPASTAQPQT